MDARVILLMLFSVACGVAGQCFFRFGMKAVGPVDFGFNIIWHFLRPPIVAGIVCYCVATSSWLVIVSRVPLSLAYPMVSFSYLLVVLAGRYIFHETVTAATWIGVLLICVGVATIGLGARAAPPKTELNAPQSRSSH